MVPLSDTYLLYPLLCGQPYRNLIPLSTLTLTLALALIPLDIVIPKPKPKPNLALDEATVQVYLPYPLLADMP